MKVKLIIFTLLMLSLLIVSCDRFEKPEFIDYNLIVTDFFNDFSATADSISADNTEQFMSFFAVDYLHNGKNKQDIENIIRSIYLVNEPRFISIKKASNNYFSVEWNLIVSTTDEVVVDSLYFNDTLRKIENRYYLYGNHVEASNVEKLRPFTEIMTATWCGTCPQVESFMHDYLSINPYNFFYLEFHSQDAIAGEHEFFDNFYALTSSPSTVIQGKDILAGAQSEIFLDLLDSYKEMDAQLKLSNLLKTANTENYQAQVDIEKLINEEFDTTNLKLRWAFYEEVSATNNYIGVPCRNVVLTEGYYGITDEDLDTNFSISIDYPREIPEDMGIVFWLQRTNDIHDDDSFVYSWIKQDVGSK